MLFLHGLDAIEDLKQRELQRFRMSVVIPLAVNSILCPCHAMLARRPTRSAAPGHLPTSSPGPASSGAGSWPAHRPRRRSLSLRAARRVGARAAR